MRVLAAVELRRAAGLQVLDLSAGQPAAAAPLPVREAGAAFATRDRLGYTGALGLPALREAIAGHYLQRYGLSVDAASVVLTTGSSGGLQLAFLAAFDAGDTVVLASPGYPAYRNMLTALGCRVIELELTESFALSKARLEELEQAPAGLVIASPANPTSTMLAPATVAELARWCQSNGVRLISDEIYHGITYGAPAESSWSTSRTGFVLNSFSKYFCMPGWRLGWLLVPDGLLDAVDRLAGNFTICPPTLSQHAALAVFHCYPELDAHVQAYAVTRGELLRRLPEIGLTNFAPIDGAFYVYADVSRWTDDSLGFAAELLSQTGVAVAPGVDFDQHRGNEYIRMCFAGDSVLSAVDRLGDWLADRAGQ